MIAAAQPVVTPAVPQPAPSARGSANQGGAGDDDAASFARTLDAQGAPPAGDSNIPSTSEAADALGEEGAALGTADAPAANDLGAPPPLDIASTETALALAASPPGATDTAAVAMAGNDLLALLSGIRPSRTDSSTAITAASTEPVVAGDARPLIDVELQRPLLLPGGANTAQLVAVPASTDAAREGAGASEGERKDAAASAAPTATPSPLATEMRGELRPSQPFVSAGPARPPELRSHPGTSAWTDELGARVVWMLDRGEQIATLRLSPENLGPLEVRIAIREGETSVWFGAAQAETRAALEQSLSRLREMLGASGLSLADAGVFSETPRDPQRGFTAAALARASQESGGDPLGTVVSTATRRGLVDLYA